MRIEIVDSSVRLVCPVNAWLMVRRYIEGLGENGVDLSMLASSEIRESRLQVRPNIKFSF